MKRVLWSLNIATGVLGPILFLLCLRQWGSEHPWSRLDLYALAFLVLGFVVGLEEAVTFAPSAYRRTEVAREALGLSYDPALYWGGLALNAALILVALDYGQWHLAPVLERPFLQSAGLVLGILGVIWQARADIRLARHFADDLTAVEMMVDGPYRSVRHPRYAAFLVRKVAWALLFASVIGWCLVPFWLLLILRRIRREEEHMRERFGHEYEAYARRTPSLFPGIR